MPICPYVHVPVCPRLGYLLDHILHLALYCMKYPLKFYIKDPTCPCAQMRTCQYAHMYKRPYAHSICPLLGFPMDRNVCWDCYIKDPVWPNTHKPTCPYAHVSICPPLRLDSYVQDSGHVDIRDCIFLLILTILFWGGPVGLPARLAGPPAQPASQRSQL